MEPIDYINQFRMTEEDYEFNREDFLKAFSQEFLDYLKNNTQGLDENGNLLYSRFKEILSSFNSKFLAISQLKSHLRPDHIGLSKRYWGYFYSHIVLPERARRFPKEHQIILNHRKTRQNICPSKLLIS